MVLFYTKTIDIEGLLIYNIIVKKQFYVNHEMKNINNNQKG